MEQDPLEFIDSLPETEKPSWLAATSAAMAKSLPEAAESARSRVRNAVTPALGNLANSISALIDTIVPDDPVLSIKVRISGLCNSKLDDDLRNLMHAVSVKVNDAPIEVKEITTLSLRNYTDEEVTTSLQQAYEQCNLLFGGELQSDELSVQTQPVKCHELMSYVCVIQGLGSCGRCISQSFNIRERTKEWERLVLRSALRTALEEWIKNASWK